jgi:hypothetical protein
MRCFFYCNICSSSLRIASLQPRLLGIRLLACMEYAVTRAPDVVCLVACLRRPLRFSTFASRLQTRRCASKKGCRAPSSQHRPCHLQHVHGRFRPPRRSKNQNTTSQSWRWRPTRSSSRQTRRRSWPLRTGSASCPSSPLRTTCPRSSGRHSPTRRLRRSTRAITPMMRPRPQTPVLRRWATRYLGSSRRSTYMRAIPICRLACSRPRSARTSVRGRVRRSQRRLELLPCYVGRERCAFTRFSALASYAHSRRETFSALDANQTRRAPPRRDGLDTSGADGSRVPLSLPARRAQIRPHILPLARGRSEKFH